MKHVISFAGGAAAVLLVEYIILLHSTILATGVPTCVELSKDPDPSHHCRPANLP